MKRIIILITLLFATQSFANDFYTPTGAPATSSFGSSATIRNEYALIEDGFDKLPTMTGNGDLPVFINTAGTAMEAISASSGRTKLGLAIGTDVQAYDANLPTWPATVDATEVGYLNGLTGAIQGQLDLKAPLASPALTGTPTAPTAANGTATTQLATTAYVIANASSVGPNLIFNSDFVVNQEAYSADGVDSLLINEYGHDGFKSVNGTTIYTKESDGDITLDSVTNTTLSTANVGIRQINDDILAADGEQVTFSLYVVSLTSPIIFYPGTGSAQTISSTGWYSYTYTVNGSNPYITLAVSLAPSASSSPAFRFNSMKLERGAARTAYQKPEPVAEANRCYRYFVSYPLAHGLAGYGGAATVSDFTHFLPTVMSTTTALTVTATSSDVYSDGSVATATFSTAVLMTGNMVVTQWTHSSLTGNMRFLVTSQITFSRRP